VRHVRVAGQPRQGRDGPGVEGEELAAAQHERLGVEQGSRAVVEIDLAVDGPLGQIADQEHGDLSPGAVPARRRIRRVPVTERIDVVGGLRGKPTRDPDVLVDCRGGRDPADRPIVGLLGGALVDGRHVLGEDRAGCVNPLELRAGGTRAPVEHDRGVRNARFVRVPLHRWDDHPVDVVRPARLVQIVDLHASVADGVARSCGIVATDG
jgi:hypothetical protein